MNIAVAVKLDGLLRGLRLTGHALAENAERAALRLRSGAAAAPARAPEAPDREEERA